MGNLLSQEKGYSADDIDKLLNQKANSSELQNYAAKTALAGFAKSSDFDNYVKKIELSSYQPKGDYATANHNHDADLKTKTMWCATGDLCEIPANKNVKFGGNLDVEGMLKVKGKNIDDYIAGKAVSEDNVISGLASNSFFIGNVQKTLYENQKSAINTVMTNSLKSDADFIKSTKGDKGDKGPSGTISSNTGFQINGRNTIEFGAGVDGKYAEAGKIGYGTFDNGGSLNVVGAGKAGELQVKVFDDLTVVRNATVNGGIKAGGFGVGANCTEMVKTLQPGQVNFGGDMDNAASNAFYVAGKNANGSTWCRKF
jgi:hypothetical protein